jgi:hypothetical protein
MMATLQKALSDARRLLQMDNQDWSFLLEQSEQILADMPGDDVDGKITEIRDCYLTMLRLGAKDMPEDNQNLIALAFAEKLRARMKAKIQ